jgi:hypothetical protein
MSRPLTVITDRFRLAAWEQPSGRWTIDITVRADRGPRALVALRWCDPQGVVRRRHALVCVPGERRLGTLALPPAWRVVLTVQDDSAWLPGPTEQTP